MKLSLRAVAGAVGPQQELRIGSATKAFTAALVTAPVEQKKLSSGTVRV